MNINDPFLFPNKVSAKNRLFKSAMSEQLGDSNHNPTLDLAKLYSTWAMGGIAINISGNIMIDRGHLGEPRNVVLDERSDLELFRTWAKAGKKENCLFIVQLNHPGKQSPSFLTKQPVAPSAIALGSGLDKVFNLPRALEDFEIKNIIQKFATAAKLSKQAGFDGVQIHGAHGYLVNQFLSPLHNQRMDEWGGSLENRMRFVNEILKAIKEQTSDDFLIGIKLNSSDFQKGGFSEEESVEVIRKLEASGIHFIEISGGNYESPVMIDGAVTESTKKREAYFLDYAKKVRAFSQVPLIVTGGFRSTAAMNAALEDNALDFIGLARPLAVETDCPNKLLNSDYKVEFKEPSTGNRKLDKFSMLSITWYEAQLKRIAQGKIPKKNLSPWTVIASMIFQTGLAAFKKRRA